MASRADNQDGSCKQVISGRHEGKWRVQYTLTDHRGQKRRLSRLFDRQSEGKEFLRGLKRKDDVAIAASLRPTRLGEFFDWLVENDWNEELDPKTVAARKGRFERYARRRWGDVPLTKIDPIEVKGFYRMLREDGVGQATVLELKRDLVRVFNQAITPYQRVPHTAGNPFKLTVAAPPRRTAVALTPDAARKALGSQKLDPERRAMLALYLLGGLRLSEHMAITAGQVLLAQDLITVDRSVKFDATGGQTVGLPKGGKVRAVVMCRTLKALLGPVLAGKGPDELLWPADVGNKPRMKKLAYATWRTIARDAGLPEGTSPHDMRLSHINWIEKLMPSVSETTFKEHIGHAAEGVTQVNYTRPISPAQKILRDGIERVAGLKEAAPSRPKPRSASGTPPVGGA